MDPDAIENAWVRGNTQPRLARSRLLGAPMRGDAHTTALENGAISSRSCKKSRGHATRVRPRCYDRRALQPGEKAASSSQLL